MPILSGDVKLLKSVNMADVAEGGGAPTGLQIADGLSNAIFPDISELDRAGGRVNLRKTFVGVHSDDTDTYFGANVIVAEPPSDPRVSVTLFTSGAAFDVRTEAKRRVEAYLNVGPEWAGFLYENHLAGQRVVQLFQRPLAELPTVGKTLTLVEGEGTASEKVQYVRVTSVSSVARTFGAINVSDYEANIVTLGISDALRYDFKGSPASPYFTYASGTTKIRDTVVADAGTYVGVVPLTQAASLGEFGVQAASIFTQLVPSAQTETPISDVRPNGVSNALVSTGGAITQSVSLAFTTSQNMFVGSPIYPGSLTIVRSGVTAVDVGGSLQSAGLVVGRVDYDNGIVSLSSNIFGSSSGSHQVTFTPAATPELVSDQRAIRVTPESRALSYAFVIEDKVAPRTMSVSYLAQGRWYVLRDDGSGALRGSDSSYGTGTLNYTTGAVVVTLGALPDVGSAIIVSSYSEVSSVPRSNTELRNGGKAYFAFNTSSQASEEKGEAQISPTGLTVTWSDGGATKTATDDGMGNLTGDATGTVDYAAGVVRMSPNALPASGTIINATTSGKTGAVSAGVTLESGTLGATNIEPGSISFSMPVSITYVTGYDNTVESWANVSFSSRSVTASVRDDGAGNLVANEGNQDIAIGTVNYASGAITINGTSAYNGSRSWNLQASDAGGPMVTRAKEADYVSVSWNDYPGSKSRGMWYTANVAFNVNYANAGADSAKAVSLPLEELRISVPAIPNYNLKGVRFLLGGSLYVQLPDNAIAKDPSPTTGGGSPAGFVSPSLGVVSLSSWAVGAATTVSDWRGLMAPPTVGAEVPFGVPSSVFRTASAPLRPGSLSVVGTLQDGTTFNVNAGVNGKIDGTRVKGRVDYEFGVVELYFVNPDGPAQGAIDLSHLQIDGLTTIAADIGMLPSLRYNAVSYSYLPLDASILGIDPVRLPSDGRVPIFRPGGFAVVGHTGELSATVMNNQTIDCGRVRLSRVRVLGADGSVINTGYETNLEAGTVTFTDISGYVQPVTIQHRIEDMAVVREVDINGSIYFTRPLTHHYPVGSFVSSALVAGDLFAQVNTQFDQSSWDGTFKDATSGNAATGTRNTAQYPIAVTNRGAVTERWAVRFTNSTSFDVIGEHIGVIATGNTSTDCAPLNPATGVPYFTIPAAGWGNGWATGNVFRFNTVGAMFPVWVVRTVQQGPETVTDDNFTLLIRGDVNA